MNDYSEDVKTLTAILDTHNSLPHPIRQSRVDQNRSDCKRDYLNAAKIIFLKTPPQDLERVYTLACEIANQRGFSDLKSFLHGDFFDVEAISFPNKYDYLILTSDHKLPPNNISSKNQENKNIIHWTIDKDKINTILDYLICTKQYVVLPENLTQNDLCELLIGSGMPREKISWTDTSNNFGKLFHLLFENNCFKDTTKKVLNERLLEIFSVKSAKGDEPIKFNTLKEYLSGNSLKNTFDFDRIRAIVTKR